MATLAIGRLYVVGTTDKPHTPVTLDQRFQTVSDDAGHFSFEEIYHPATCIVGIDIESRLYRAVVSNCAQQMPIGFLPFVGAVLPSIAATPRTAPTTSHATSTVSTVHPVKPKPKPRLKPKPRPDARSPALLEEPEL